MAGFAKDGTLYPTGGVYGINDDIVSSDTGWSSQKIMNKLASVKSIIRVDAKPTIADGTVTYIKGGASYTTTDQETWFYYVVDEELYKTIFIDGVEYTKADSSVSFDDFIEKTDIVTVLDATVTNEQVPSAKSVNDFVLGRVKPIIIQYDFGSTFSIEKYGITQDNTASEVLRKIADYYKGIYGNGVYLKLTFNTNNNSSTFALSLPTKGESSMVTVLFCPWQLQNRCQITVHNLITGELFTGGFNNSANDIVWKKVCTTSVPDVPKTTITPTDATYYSISDTNGSWYMVKNGWCIVNLRVTCNTVNIDSNNVFFDSIPKSAGYVDAILFSMSSTYKQPIQVNIFGNNQLLLRRGEAGIGYIGSFSYPVADDWRP